jgi:hypothetical protein
MNPSGTERRKPSQAEILQPFAVVNGDALLSIGAAVVAAVFLAMST